MAPPQLLRHAAARLATLAACAALLGRRAGAEDYMDDTRACDRFYPRPVHTLCHESFPGQEDDKMWFVLFTSHRCPECQQVKDRFVQLAKELEDDPGVALAAVDCYWSVNYNKLCHPRHKVDLVPAVRVVERGKLNLTEKPVLHQYPRHKSEDIDRLVREQLEHRPRCPMAALGAQPGRVVPLCKGRFPSGRGLPQDWLVVFYSQASPGAGQLLEAFSEVSLHLGNGEDAEAESDWGRLKKQDRLLALEKHYGVRLAMQEQGSFGFGTLAKVGGVCCDCDDAQAAFCALTLGAGEAPTLPVAAWIQDGERVAVEAVGETPSSIMEFALSSLGVLEAAGEL